MPRTVAPVAPTRRKLPPAPPPVTRAAPPRRAAPPPVEAPAAPPAVMRAPPRAAVSPPPPMPRGAVNAARPAPVAAPVAVGPSPETIALRAELASMRGEIEKLTKAAARAKQGPIARTEDEIRDGIEIPAEDWRAAYHGQAVYLHAWMRPNAKQGFLKPAITLTGAAPVLALLAMPRDADGPMGAQARALGELASHETRNEAGDLVGEPYYINTEELALLWDHESNGT